MGLRVCLVTPFAWSQPHDVNEHVAGLAAELRELGHSVPVLAPSTRAADLIAGRRALLDGGGDQVIVLGPALPVSRRSRIGVPVGDRANLALALARGDYDVVHGFEPGLPSLSYLALRDARAFPVPNFLSPEPPGAPHGKAQRTSLPGRVDRAPAAAEPAVWTAGHPPLPARPGARAHIARRCRASTAAERGVRLRPGLRRSEPRRARGCGRRRGDRLSPRPARAAGARRRRDRET